MALVRRIHLRFNFFLFTSIFLLIIISFFMISTFLSSSAIQSDFIYEYHEEFKEAIDKHSRQNKPHKINGPKWFTRSESKKARQKLYEEDLNKYRLWALRKQREILEAEMKDFQHENTTIKVDKLLMENGGQPIRSMVFATYRTGSTFVGDILKQHPGTYYHLEPFIYMGPFIQIRSGKLADEAIRAAKELFNCRYNKLAPLIFVSKTRLWVHSRNSRLWEYCKKNQEVCWNSQFLSSMCKLFPFQSMKTVRLRLKFAKTLLDEEKLNLKTLLLVRDPRGILQSRYNLSWCQNTECANPNTLCADMVDNFYEAKMLYKKYPNRFMALRYEDISLNPFSATKKLYKFFGIQYSKQIEDFVYNHTTNNNQYDVIKDAYTTFRNSKDTPFHWKTDFLMKFNIVEEIQKTCSKAMDLWGYAPVFEKSQLLKFNPLKKTPWRDMNILP